jgi:hypothetical protein
MLSFSIDKVSIFIRSISAELAICTRAIFGNEKMVRFYLTKDTTEMMAFMVACRGQA